VYNQGSQQLKNQAPTSLVDVVLGLVANRARARQPVVTDAIASLARGFFDSREDGQA
jgi:hypothetical protein